MAQRLENPWGKWGTPRPNLKGKRLNFEEKAFLAQAVNIDGRSTTEVAETYGLTKQLIHKYAKKFRLNEPTFDRGGRPPKFDHISEDNMRKEFGGDKAIQISERQAAQIYRKEAESTALRRNQSPVQIRPPSRSTCHRWEKNNSVVTMLNPEEGTSARIEACADIRNMVSVLAAFHSIKDIRKDFICNFDASIGLLLWQF